MLSSKIFSIKNPINDLFFEQFYSLMEVSFPESERRSKKAFRELTKHSPYYKIISLFEDEELIAFFTVWEFEDFTFGDHFAVLPKCRNRGIGAELLSEVKKSCTAPLIIEAEPSDDGIATRRLNFYFRNGFFEGDFDYLLPPMQEDFAPLPMRILSYPEKLSQSEFENYKNVIYKTVYNV